MRIVAAVAVLMLGVVSLASPPDPNGEARQLFNQKKYNEAAQLLEAYLAGNRFDGPSWALYSECLHFGKQYERAIEAGKKALAFGRNRPGQSYNIACGYALLGKPDEAIAWLQKALEERFADQRTLESDEDLDSLRQDPRFIRLTGLKPPPESSPARQWEWDLDFLVRRMEQMHWRLYDKVSKAEFNAAIQKLKADAPNLSRERQRARLSQILARVGDGHTLLAAFAEGENAIRRVPLHLYSFTDGLFVIGAPELHKELLGAQVVRVGSLTADEALARARAFCSVDNDMGYVAGAPLRLCDPGVLQEIGAAGDESAEWSFRFPNGTTRSLVIAPESIARSITHGGPLFRPGLLYANTNGTPPLYQRDLGTPLTLDHLPDARAVYVGFHAVQQNPKQSVADFVTEMNRKIADTQAENLIIDMRLNGGGNTGLVAPIIHALVRNDRINRPGHLFVIIGRNTFSAAQNTVNMIEKNTHATFVGEPTGSRPNFVGESTYIVMPYSKLRVSCSSRYWQFGDSTDDRPWVQPQIACELSSRDFIENRDPCLDAILKRLAVTPSGQPPDK